MISVVDLRKSFTAPDGQRIEVLRGVTFSAKAGEGIAITGVSGSGKSTLLHLLGGLEAPDHGNFELDSANSEGQSVGFVFQFHYLLPDLSAVENVALPLLIARWKRNRAIERAMVLLEEMNLSDRSKHPISHLSGGEQQRVAVARALITRPKLLLADEPTGNLDTENGDQIGRVLIEYAHNHSAITIIATHSAKLAQSCDRVLRLEGGRTSESVISPQITQID